MVETRAPDDLRRKQTTYISSLFSRAQGVVLEFGPGSGDQMRHLEQGVREGKITKMVGVEPNVALHDLLLSNARDTGLDPHNGEYIVLEAGAEPSTLIPALHKAGLCASDVTGEGIFDTIICVKSMCSVPQDQLTQICTTVQTLLKPGGEFLFFEHVAHDRDYFTIIYAWLLGWIWPVCMGNCHLNGTLDKVVGHIGGWDSVDVRNAREFRWSSVFWCAVGVCRK